MKRREPNTEQLELNMAALPELCYAVIEDFTGESETRVGIIKRGVSGYFPYSVPAIMEQAVAKKFCDEQNDRLEVTEAQAKAMLFGSLFGWDTPGAHPDALNNQPRELA